MKCGWRKNIKRTALTLILVNPMLIYALTPHITFTQPMGAPSWNMTGNPIRCGLKLKIPNYGIGYFEQYAAQPPHFVLRKWDDVTRSLPATIVVRPPMWKPEDRTMPIGSVNINPGPYSIFLKRDSTLKLLTYLARGYETTFQYRSDIGFGVTVALTPMGFQKAYARYQECVGNLLPFGLERVKHSVFYFPSESWELSDADHDQLRRIAKYVAADHQIKTIRVVGYADKEGRNGYNNALSQKRAEAVQNYLTGLGVPEEQLSITWKGEMQPVARNDTDAGRAQNRRVVINLIKK
ncbi:MAG: flagellar protein MotY [Legionella sp. 40-6]|nr:OmpA family protein [Legionella sp.]OJY53278.1 MAG: flagellar protein MotY [Legionella sp. 40-6]